MIDAPTVRRSSGSSAFTVAFVPTGMNWGVSTAPWVSVSRPRRARVEPSGGGATRTSNDEAARTMSAPFQERDHGRQDHGNQEHRPERDKVPHVLPVDDDVAGQVTEDPDPRPGHDDQADDGDDDAEDDERPANALHAGRFRVQRTPPALARAPARCPRGLPCPDRRDAAAGSHTRGRPDAPDRDPSRSGPAASDR